jgi:hypothetical protein
MPSAAPACATASQEIALPRTSTSAHTLNVYGGYRLKPTVNLSVKLSYGSGFTIPGYLQKTGAVY